MQTTLPLDELSVSEKLVVINEVWDSLMQTKEAIPSPKWHEEVLLERAKNIQNGNANFKSLAVAKKELQKKFE